VTLKGFDGTFFPQLAHVDKHVSRTGSKLCAALPIYVESRSSVECKLLLTLPCLRVPYNRSLQCQCSEAITDWQVKNALYGRVKDTLHRMGC